MNTLDLTGFQSYWVEGGVEGAVKLHCVHNVSDANADQPVLFFVHGYPDDYRIWSEQMRDLASQYRIIALDLRGMGQSEAPVNRKAYRIKDILEDMAVVLRTVLGAQQKVHMIAHDWGSIVSWHFVTHADYGRQYVKSYTTLSGPHLGMVQATLMQAIKQKSVSQIGRLSLQALKSWYILAFQVPKIPDYIVQKQGRRIWRQTLLANGVRADDAYMQDADEASMIKNLSNGIQLYRCNASLKHAAPKKHGVKAPVLLFIVKKDAFLAPHTFDNVEDYAETVTRITVDAHHWAMREMPEKITAEIDVFVRRIEHQAENVVAENMAAEMADTQA